MATSDLVESFTAALPAERRGAVTAAAAAALAAAVAAARAAHPSIEVPDAALAAFLAERLPDHAPIADALAALPASDLLLACGCARGITSALAAFEAVLAEVDAAGRTARAAADLVDEVKQRLRTQLLVVAGGKPAGIAAFRGRGSLRGWVRVAATRELVRLEQHSRRARPLEDAFLDDAAGDPAVELLKARYRAELSAAIKDAVGRLSSEDRTLLRHHLIDRLSIDELGARYSVHRATAARWLARARSALVAATETELAVRLRLAPDEVTSVIRMVASRLDASLAGALDDTRDG
jgi:RNA polymerase sigma-70 factor (ECF subfamily)